MSGTLIKQPLPYLCPHEVYYFGPVSQKKEMSFEFKAIKLNLLVLGHRLLCELILST